MVLSDFQSKQYLCDLVQKRSYFTITYELCVTFLVSPN